MRDAVWRVLSYLGFLGLFTSFYGRGSVARHGRRGVTIFVWEVIGFVFYDVIRVKFGWPLWTFGPIIGAVTCFKVVLMARAFKDASPVHGRDMSAKHLGGK